ncbi:DNA-directed RNA polymerase III subunit RPC1 [Scenedesmus sp. PABB004]|nr:DNA-directed RNA polymerase III subunit RPC1 [Scenedesmus sp. PABB004]
MLQRQQRALAEARHAAAAAAAPAGAAARAAPAAGGGPPGAAGGPPGAGGGGGAGALVFTKEPFKPPEVPRKIQQIRFGLQTPQAIINCGVFHVHERALYKMPERVPHPNGVLDPRLGVSSKAAVCRTCGQKLADCAGHFGFLKLELPVFHIGYFKNTVQLLQCICKTCSRVLLPEEERRRMIRRFRSPKLERVPRELLFRRVIETCKRARVCHHCGAYNGTVKKASGSLKILHEAYAKNADAAEALRSSLAEAAGHNEALAGCLPRVADDLHPLRALGLFRAVAEEDLAVLDIAGRPEDLLLSVLPVPPVAIRPSVEMDGASNEDDVTMKLMQIIEVNNVLRQGLEKGLPINTLMENWDFLQVQAAMLINSDLPGVALQNQAPGRPLRGFVQRLKGKQGRFRGNLSGKRVDFSGRTVISPDPDLAIHQVAVPVHMATVLTYPERVAEYNLAKLRGRVANGAGTWPGANFVGLGDGSGARIWLRDEKIRRKAATDLKVGDIVERHLEDGDVVLFNRQPSLHRVSIQAFRAVVRPGRTLRFNECVCAPFNADFDGDEMNLHLPQTEEARAEALCLMGSVANLATPKNGDVLIAATQDFLTCAFLLSGKDVFLTRPAFGQLAAAMGDARDHVDLPPPAVLKPVELWTGKQLFGVMVRPNAETRVFVDLELPEREYSKRGESMCPKDGWVLFRGSALLAGRLGKATLGGAKGGLFGALAADFSPATAAAVMGRLAKMSARAMGELGFSIGIDDVTPHDTLLRDKAATLASGYAEVQDYIAAYGRRTLALEPGCDLEQSLEANVTGVLNGIREAAGKVCMESLDRHNSPLVMSQCGSKGSAINIAQMVACVGQQSVGGRRCFNGFKDRTLPHFPRGDKTPEGRGFVASSFFSGLSPSEFFFHTMAGREGLVDTAVKTAETGYMSRRLMKALEDLYVHYDATVRNAAGGVVSLSYGDDGLDPLLMEGPAGAPLDFPRLLAKVRSNLSGAHAAAVARRARAGGGGGDASGAPPREEVPLPGELRAAVDAALAVPELAAPVDDDLGGKPDVLGQAPPGGGGGGGAGSSSAAAAAAAGAPGRAPRGDVRGAWDGAVFRAGLAGGRPWASKAFRQGLAAFLHGLVDRYASTRARLGMPADARGTGPGAAVLEYVAGCDGLTRSELAAFVGRAVAKYGAKRVDPGSTVGAVGAQSIGEPGTQMTLKTFHFAGVASMNVTLGVPRIKEIINGARAISTPILRVALSSPTDLVAARLVKGRLERTSLGQVAQSISIVLRPGSGSAALGEAHIAVVLDMAAIAALALDVDAASVKQAVLDAPKLKLRPDALRVLGRDTLLVVPPDGGASQGLLFALEQLMAALPKVIVQGIPSVERAVISRNKDETYTLLVEGTGLQAVMGTLGVRGEATSTNHVAEVERVLGIEAARRSVMAEIKYTMGSHGMAIDDRHTMLLADCMTYKGEVLGITRFGIAKMKDSVLHSASFEKTADHLFDAAIHGRADDVVGVSESIIMGIPMPTGTGLFRLVQEPGSPPGGGAPPPAPRPTRGGRRRCWPPKTRPTLAAMCPSTQSGPLPGLGAHMRDPRRRRSSGTGVFIPASIMEFDEALATGALPPPPPGARAGAKARSAPLPGGTGVYIPMHMLTEGGGGLDACGRAGLASCGQQLAPQRVPRATAGGWGAAIPAAPAGRSRRHSSLELDTHHRRASLELPFFHSSGSNACFGADPAGAGDGVGSWPSPLAAGPGLPPALPEPAPAPLEFWGAARRGAAPGACGSAALDRAITALIAELLDLSAAPGGAPAPAAPCPAPLLARASGSGGWPAPPAPPPAPQWPAGSPSPPGLADAYLSRCYEQRRRHRVISAAASSCLSDVAALKLQELLAAQQLQLQIQGELLQLLSVEQGG